MVEVIKNFNTFSNDASLCSRTDRSSLLIKSFIGELFSLEILRQRRPTLASRVEFDLSETETIRYGLDQQFV